MVGGKCNAVLIDVVFTFFFFFFFFFRWSSAALAQRAKDVEQKHEWMSDMASAMLLHGDDEGEWWAMVGRWSRVEGGGETRLIFLCFSMLFLFSLLFFGTLEELQQVKEAREKRGDNLQAAVGTVMANLLSSSASGIEAAVEEVKPPPPQSEGATGSEKSSEKKEAATGGDGIHEF